MIEELGYDKNRKASSQPLIKNGINRGCRKPEKDGRWIYITGYDEYNRQSEKSIHVTWAKKLISLGNRIGSTSYDGVVHFYLFDRVNYNE